ncbi:SDR family NAD(P)-dependent oxidoreductase [Mycobacterium sp. M23085]|uniref:SDR family NAD(P)-dependent oxidoreductase n=1 Tax=Mycobacterium sp. M23085 TaxID=3378087 RepID=UPI003877978C
MGHVEGKTIVVTGAAHGIGRATAELLATSGAHVVVTDIDEAGAEAAAEALGDQAVFFRHDVSSSTEWQRLITLVKQRFPTIDGLVNNAGRYLPGTIADTTEESFDSQVAVNQKGTFLGVKYVSQEMKGSGGLIVNTSSICGIRGIPGCIAYNSTKWAIRGITRTAARELAPFNIRVNAVLPGFVGTALIAANPPEMNAAAKADTPLGRLGHPQDIATLTRYLLSDESSFVTGADFLADGGYTL